MVRFSGLVEMKFKNGESMEFRITIICNYDNCRSSFVDSMVFDF